ncbi:PAS domain S-box protein [Desulfopila sp. IMCC35006]|uniref:PAS domain S-box protein n=1 Tax=Desulfopila sp. IMCC35006 TaxID=2569542 RepID=UPI0010AB9546|nr:PAS domain S-box protein [Desulfopila sp. IMCC35006]TKB25226.1 PAS domain S-box protein [Desulfopila sp. IMCC35006]
MISGVNLFFSLFNNLAIFIALVTIYGYLLVKFDKSDWYRRQVVIGFSFGIFAIGCMYARIPVFEGVLVDQRNAIIVLSGVFGGPLAAFLSAVLAGSFRIYLGGGGALAGVVGVSLAAIAGIVLNKFPGRFTSIPKAAVSALFATLIILPGFLFVGNLQTGWTLLKAMTLPYGLAIFSGIFLVGLLLNREDERHHAELSFQESEKKYRELIEGTQDLITHADSMGNFTFVNHVAEKILGFAPQECIGRSAFQFVHPDDKEKTIEWFNKCLAQKTNQAKIENRQVNAQTGASHTVLWSSSFHYDNSGNLAGIGGIGRDISEIRAVEQNYKALFEQMPDGYAIYEILRNDHGWPVDYRFLSINPAYEKITGLTAGDLIGKTLREVFFSNADYWIERYSEITLTAQPVTFESFLADVDKYVEVTAYTIFDNQFACIFEEITLRKKAEEEKRVSDAQLRHALKMEAIGTLSGGIAHDFNNILTVILGYAELVKIDISDSERVTKDINEVLKAGNRAKDLVTQILAFCSKKEQSRLPVKLDALIKETADFLRATLPATIEITLNIEPNCGYILADPTQIHQILMNLCTNAAHAMEEKGGVLRIDASVMELTADDPQFGSSHKPGTYILLSIKDTGVGIIPEHLDRIFDPYFTTKEIGKGSGLGLALVHGIVQSHDGHILVESKPGKGTTFKLLFPKYEALMVAQTADATVLPAGTENILIVDDDISVASLTQKRLENLGYTVTAKINSPETLELFRSDPQAYDLVITDQTMPDMTGAQLAEELIAIRPDLPIVMCTGYSSKIDADKADIIGIKAFLMKPIDNQKLASTVRKLLDAS